MYAVLFHRLGPYHHARLSALASRCELAAIECSTVDNTYKWDIVKAENNFPVYSLFTDADVDNKSANEVLHQTWSVLDRIKPLTVAIPGWSSAAALAALSWCVHRNTPAILMADSTEYDEPRDRWKEWIKSRVVRLFDAALVGGAPHVDYVCMLGIARERAFTGYDVVDNDYFSRHASKVRSDAGALRIRCGLPEKYFLASNRFVEKKNLSRLLDAYAASIAQVGTSAWGLVLLGDGPLKDELTDQVDRLGLNGSVIFPGFKQYDELPIYYGLASAFIHSSTTEQWGLVVNEAMASGLPVLVSERCGCAPDLVRNGVNGFTFDPYDLDGMTTMMLRISGGGIDLYAMGQASSEIIQQWEPETFAENMVKAAEAALAAPRRRVAWFDQVLLSVLVRR